MSEREEGKSKGFVFVDKRKTREVEAGPADAAGPDQTAPREQSDEAAPSADTAKKPPLPEVDFTFFILSLSSSAMVQMGVIPNPATHKKEKNLEAAKQTIDIIAMLEKKTRGNLTSEEEQFLASVLYDLRMKYVELTK